MGKALRADFRGGREKGKGRGGSQRSPRRSRGETPAQGLGADRLGETPEVQRDAATEPARTRAGAYVRRVLGDQVTNTCMCIQAFQ